MIPRVLAVLLSLAVLATSALAAGIEPTPVQSRIQSVLVHPAGATITRVSAVHLAAGAISFRFEDLPAWASESSFRATTAKGPAGTEIVGLVVGTVVERRERTPEVAALEEKIEDLRRRSARLGDRIDVLEGEIERLHGIEAREPPRQEGEPAPLDPAAWQAVVDRVRTGLEKALAGRASARQERKEVDRDLERAELRLRESASARLDTRRRADVEVRASEAGPATIELRYFVPGAGWKPTYRLRVLPDRSAIEAETWARVLQSTGEDWRDAEISFATALPSLEAGPPEMSSWRIRENEPLRPGSSTPQTEGADKYFLPPPARDPTESDGSSSAGLDTGFFEPPSKYTGEKITLDLVEENIREVLQKLADMGHLSLVLSEEVSGKVTLKLTNIPWDQALDAVLKTKGLGYEREGQILRIAPYEGLEKEQERRISERRRADALDPVIVKIIPVQYAVAREILPHLRQIRSRREDVSIEVDDRSNSLIVKDTEKIVNIMADMIQSLDGRVYPGEPAYWERYALARGVDFGSALAMHRGDTSHLLGRLETPELPRSIPELLRNAAEPAPIAVETGGDGGAPKALGTTFDHVFRLIEITDLPSDGRPRAILLDRTTLPARLAEEVVPAVRAEAFLVASLDARRDAPFLDGAADVFLGPDYLGRTVIRASPAGEPIRISLGVDSGIAVTREDDVATEDVGLAEDAISESHHVSIRLENRSGAPTTLVVRERIPFTQEDDIRVRLDEAEPEPLDEDAARDRKWGILTWRREIPKDGDDEIRYQWSIRRPRAIEVRLGERPDLAENR